MTEQISLHRNLSLPLLIFYGLGNIIGAGIYVLVGKVAGVAGMYAPVSFFIACLLALFTAFSYAELSARYPLSAGESIYLHHGFGIRFLSVGVGLLMVVGGMLSSAAILKGFVGYLSLFIVVPETIAIIVSAILLCGFAIWGIKESVRAAALLTILELIGLLMVLWAGRQDFLELPSRIGELIPPFQLQTWHGIFFGGLLAFYAFIGFEDMVNVAEEVKNPERNMPLSILTALAVATLFYMLIAILAVLTVSPALLQESEAPLVLVYQAVGGGYPKAIAAIAMFAVINGVLIQIIMASRIL
ncbi:MAG: amino acid permease, partial [Gammaproteobacteria bacterium]|nr:amino acid permease [Gammaproteobacteria bacterium]